MDKFVVNIIHRPEMVPEYAEKVTGHGKEEDIGRKSLFPAAPGSSASAVLINLHLNTVVSHVFGMAPAAS